MRFAWDQLPAAHRELLEEIGASQWQVVNGSLGWVVDRLLVSAQHRGLSQAERVSIEDALAVWVPQLRLMVLDSGHQLLEGLDESAYEAFVCNNAWHEWGHALSLDRCSPEDVVDGQRLLELAPEGVRRHIRTGGYRGSQYTHELVAHIYSLLMARPRQDLLGNHNG